MVRAGSTDATVAVEFHNVYGEMIEAKSGTGTATVTVSSTAKSLAKFLIDAGYTSLPGLAPGTVSHNPLTTAAFGRLRVLTGAIYSNYGGSRDASGTNGFSDADLAPTSSSAGYLRAGDIALIGEVPL